MSSFFLKPPPSNSHIETRSELNQTILSWKNPRGGGARYFAALFLLAWLGGWSVGEYSVAMRLLNGNFSPFELFWLIGWTVGGLFAMANVYLMVRPSKPERLILDSFLLQFKPGTPPFAGIDWGRNRNRDANRSALYRKPKKKYSVPKNEIGEIKLERVGERQRLTIDHGVERIEIGEYLQEPEREWLYEILKQWKGTL